MARRGRKWSYDKLQETSRGTLREPHRPAGKSRGWRSERGRESTGNKGGEEEGEREIQEEDSKYHRDRRTKSQETGKDRFL